MRTGPWDVETSATSGSTLNLSETPPRVELSTLGLVCVPRSVGRLSAMPSYLEDAMPEESLPCVSCVVSCCSSFPDSFFVAPGQGRRHNTFASHAAFLARLSALVENPWHTTIRDTGTALVRTMVPSRVYWRILFAVRFAQIEPLRRPKGSGHTCKQVGSSDVRRAYN